MKQRFSSISKYAQSTAVAAGTMALTAATAFAQPGEIEVPSSYATDIGQVVSFAINAVMIVALLLVFLYLILGGIQWITSGGDKGKTEEARNKITAAIIGIIILAASYALVNFVTYILGIDGGFTGIFSNFGTLEEAGGVGS